MNLYKKTCLLCLLFFSFSSSILATDDLWDGGQYLENSSLQYQWARDYIQKLELRGDEKMLDIGCGDGRITAILAESLPNGSIIGIDASESMLQVAQKLKNQVHIDNLTFTKQDAMALSFENAFDFIVSFTCFHWIPDHLQALKEIEKALRPGGRVFLYFAPDHGRDRFDHAIDAVIASSKWSPYFSEFSNPFSLVTPSKFATYAEEAHLLIKRIEIITVDEVFASKAAFAAWMTGWMSHLKQLPKELHQEFLEEIIDCYLRKHPMDDDNKLHYIDYWMEVELLYRT